MGNGPVKPLAKIEASISSEGLSRVEVPVPLIGRPSALPTPDVKVRPVTSLPFASSVCMKGFSPAKKRLNSDGHLLGPDVSGAGAERLYKAPFHERAFDPQFAVSVSQVDPLPHQLSLSTSTCCPSHACALAGRRPRLPLQRLCEAATMVKETLDTLGGVNSGYRLGHVHQE